MEDVKTLLGEDLFKQVVAKLGDKQLFPFDKNQKVIIDDGTLIKKDGMIPKDRFDEVNQKKNDFEKQVSDMMKQIDDLKKSSGNKTELEQKIQKLTDDYNVLKTDAEKSTKLTAAKFALRDALRENGSKPEYVDLLETKFKLDQLVIGDDGKLQKIKLSDTDIKAFPEHLKSIKETYPDAFGEIKRKGFKPGEGGDPGAGFYSKEELESMGQPDMVKNIDKVNASVSQLSKQSK